MMLNTEIGTSYNPIVKIMLNNFFYYISLNIFKRNIYSQINLAFPFSIHWPFVFIVAVFTNINKNNNVT